MCESRFNIGDTVVLTEPIFNNTEILYDKGTKMVVDKVVQCGGTFKYICGYDGYERYEYQITSVTDYKAAG